VVILKREFVLVIVNKCGLEKIRDLLRRLYDSDLDDNARASAVDYIDYRYRAISRGFTFESLEGTDLLTDREIDRVPPVSNN